MCHPLIIGELACGNLKNGNETIALLQRLPQVNQAKHQEVLRFIEQNRLMGKGLGYNDVHLSASAVLTGAQMWTYDKRLSEASGRLGIRYPRM